MPDPDLEQGWVDAELAGEFPGLASVDHEGGPGLGPHPRTSCASACDCLASRITGGHVIHMRQDPVPWAYRVFWRQVGIDPDTDRTPVEQIALDRLKWGGLRSRNLLDDAITIATLETGVPVVAFDAAKVGEAIGLRLTGEREQLGGSGRPLSSRQIVIADEDHTLAILSGEVAEERGVTPKTASMVLASIQVKGVPLISVEEALWTVVETLTEGG